MNLLRFHINHSWIHTGTGKCGVTPFLFPIIKSKNEFHFAPMKYFHYPLNAVHNNCIVGEVTFRSLKYSERVIMFDTKERHKIRAVPAPTNGIIINVNKSQIPLHVDDLFERWLYQIYSDKPNLSDLMTYDEYLNYLSKF